MKVVHIASGDLWGGAEAQVCALARAMKAAGADVSAVVMSPGSQLAQRLAAVGVAVQAFDESRASAPALWRALRRHLRNLRPDIVHTHRFKEDILGASAAATLGIPSIRTAHGAPEPEVLGVGLKRLVLGTLDRFTARRLQSRVVAVSDDLAGKLATLLPGARVVVIVNGISVTDIVESAHSQQTELPSRVPGAIRVGFFGRLVSVKRVDLLLQMMRELKSPGGTPAELYIVGDGPLGERLHALAHELGVEDSVHFLGFRPDAAVLMRKMAIVMLVSDHEGLPMVVLEAIALGTPVLARAVGGIPELLAQSCNNVLIRSDQPRDFADAVNCFAHRLAGPHEARAGSTVPVDYTIEATSRRYLALYAEVLSERSRGSNSRQEIRSGHVR